MTSENRPPEDRVPEERVPALHLARWTVSSGSQVQSRGAVVIA